MPKFRWNGDVQDLVNNLNDPALPMGFYKKYLPRYDPSKIEDKIFAIKNDWLHAIMKQAMDKMIGDSNFVAAQLIIQGCRIEYLELTYDVQPTYNAKTFSHGIGWRYWIKENGVEIFCSL